MCLSGRTLVSVPDTNPSTVQFILEAIYALDEGTENETSFSGVWEDV